MSTPHTGKLVADIRGHRLEFDGDLWTTLHYDSQWVANTLNDVTDASPKMHFDIRGLAENILRKAGMWEGPHVILEWRGDTWEEELPPGAID